MKEIKFNVCANQYYKGGQSCETKSIQEINSKIVTSKDQQDWLQIFNAGHRVDSNNVDWTTWNGCVFIDIDSKHYYNDVRPFNTKLLYDGLLEYLRINYYYHFYNLHFSWSKTSYHIIFYFDVEKTELNFKKCAQYCKEIIIEAFTELGAKDIIKYNNVLDTCVTSCYQGLFFNSTNSDFGIFENNQWFGQWSIIDEYQLDEQYKYKANYVNEDLSNNFILTSYKTNNNKIEAHHSTRMSIYMTLIAIYKDKQIVDEHWATICENNIYCPDYSSIKMYKEADKNKWFDKFNIYSYVVNIDLLKLFGYEFEIPFIPQEFNFYEPDETIEILSNQYLSNIKLNFKTDKINHIFAGCGFGKTYWAKELSKTNKVCVISPLRSIARDSFENSNFVIIDEPHKDEAKHILGDNLKEKIKECNWSICTTWESFVAYEMYNCNFDYVIVDEIHTLYMYEYRLESINNIKKYIGKSKGIKIIMTGTPSEEINEFDCYKFKIIKEQPKVKCEMLVYNKEYIGWICNDIREWTKDNNNYAVIFKDTANYKDVEMLATEGLDVFLFNSNFEDNVDELINTKDLTHQITMISVYGQAGINILTSDKKIRLYILNNNGLATIQYANRIRNKECIDKVIIPINKNNISNNIKNIDKNIDIEEAKRKVEVVNSTVKEFDIFSSSNDQKFKFRYGFNKDCVEIGCNNKYELIEENYELYSLINRINEYEKQTQVLYNRLIQNDFDVIFNYLQKDIKRLKSTRFRNNTLAGQLVNFDKNQIKQRKMSNKLYIIPNKNLKEVATGDLLTVLEGLFNILALSTTEYIQSFTNIINKIIKDKQKITKMDIKRILNIIKISYNWDRYYDNAFIYAMNDNRWDDYKLTAVITRSMYNENSKNDWKCIADEMYNQVRDIRKTLDYVKYVDDEFIKDDTIVNNKHNIKSLNITLDDVTKTIYTYIVNQHTSGKKSGKKNAAKKIIINGIEYESKTDAYNKLGRRYVDKYLKSQK